MRKGVSDIQICRANHGFIGAWIEVKSNKGVVSLEQKIFQKDMEAEGYFTATTYGYEETVETIFWYLNGPSTF
jgi:hypothetical protein